MEKILIFFLIIPLLGFLLSLLFSERKERMIALCMSSVAGLQLLLAILFTALWLKNDSIPINIKEITLYRSENYKFFIDLYFDHITATYLLMSSLLTFLIAHFSKTYMHKDPGFKRYFNTMLLYFFGIQVIIFSGNFETLLIGWEILGLSSFLLISFYRERYLPVRNAMKVFSIYRLADMSILLIIWLTHHLFQKNITFANLHNSELVKEFTINSYWTSLTICLFIFLAVAVKSAQFPFSSWLPRAMEGPTPSSSIFYGSIAVHIGVYLLLRTYPFWSEILLAKILLIILGISSALITSSIAKVQFSIKAQIAYSSLSQIGLMLVEIALGFETLALIHMTGNAFLRSYQLLNSPSVATYLLRDQFFKPTILKQSVISTWRRKLKKTIYVLALNQYFMDNGIYKYLWFPFKKLGHKFAFLTVKIELILFTIVLTCSLLILNYNSYESMRHFSFLSELFAAFGLIYVLRAFSIRKHPYEAWLLLTINHFWIALAISFNEHYNNWETYYYLFGAILASLIGFYLLYRLAKKEVFSLDNYYGHSYEHKWLALGFLLCCLGLMGFPISSTFLGEDLMLSHINENQFLLIGIISANLMIASISIMRIYTRIFLGPNHKWYKSHARRSA